jgi:hypothetical protein
MEEIKSITQTVRTVNGVSTFFLRPDVPGFCPSKGLVCFEVTVNVAMVEREENGRDGDRKRVREKLRNRKYIGRINEGLSTKCNMKKIATTGVWSTIVQLTPNVLCLWSLEATGNSMEYQRTDNTMYCGVCRNCTWAFDLPSGSRRNEPHLAIEVELYQNYTRLSF